MGTVMVEAETVSVPGVQVPAVIVVKPGLPLVIFCGTVQAVPLPVGTARVMDDPAPNDPEEAMNVNVRLLPVDPAEAVVGPTVIVPDPSAASVVPENSEFAGPTQGAITASTS
jgi:hypothetical protein